ncbi:MAG: sugar ABC transporter substrate-binding protein [Chloroflexi bacterium]|nr:MAG: sugar ABC transporter substrate-binding protein [Chloroflexota bacterium]
MANAADANATDTPGPSAPKIALVMKTLTNPFFVEMEKGARQAEQDFGIDLIVKTAAQETSIEQQIQIVEELIRQNVDAIVIAPGDSLELIPVLKKAQDAGIVVVNIDNQLNPEYSKKLGLNNVPFISVDNEAGAYLSAKTVSQSITQPTKAILLDGILTAKNAQDRKHGALRAFEENPNITVVETQSAHWKIDEAYQVAQEMFKHTPDIGLVFCANDMMALGVIQYLDEAGRTDVQVAAYDALDEAKAAVKAGKLAVTIDQQATRQGYLGVETALKMLAGQSVPPVTLINVIAVTADTLN